MAVGVCTYLTDKDDITTTHRGHCIAKGVDSAGLGAEFIGRASGSCKGKGGSMHIADVDQGMLGANGFGTLAVAIGQIAALSTGYGAVIIAGQRQMFIASLART